MGPKTFPIMQPFSVRARAAELNLVTEIPWDLIAPHEVQAQTNHHQSLERLAQRGGLSPSEALCVIEDRRWSVLPDANARLIALVDAFRAR